MFTTFYNQSWKDIFDAQFSPAIKYYKYKNYNRIWYQYINLIKHLTLLHPGAILFYRSIMTK